MNQHSTSTIISGPSRIGREAVDAISAALGEPIALRARRLAAWDRYVALPRPTPRDEEWRRTDIRGLDLATVSLTGAAGEATGDVLGLLADDSRLAGSVVVGPDGATRVRLSPDLAAKGVVLADLATAVREQPSLLDTHLGSAVDGLADKFAALHAALWSTGTLLYVPRGVSIDLPIQILTWTANGVASFPRTLVVAEPGSDVALVDVQASSQAGDSVGEPRTPFANGAVEIVAREGASVRYASVQLWADDLWSFGSHHALVERDATVETLHVALGGRLSKASVKASLRAPGATAKMLGVVLGDGRRVFDHHTCQDHLAPSTTSELSYKAVLKDRARSVFAGLIRAGREAQKTDAVQTSRNLLLNANARADAIPMLEIEANDLRCTHAATVSPVDEDQLFFLRSRGLSRHEAQQMIVEGFVEPMLAQLPIESLRDTLRGRVAATVAANVAANVAAS